MMQLTFGTVATEPPPIVRDPLGDLAAALAAWRLIGITATQMIARLESLLGQLDALPVEESHRWLRGTALYTMLRYGPLKTPVAPHVWPWAHGVKGWLYRGHHALIVARSALLALDGAQRTAAHRRWGVLTEGGLKCNGLYRYGCPVDALATLDRRAVAARVDIIPLALAGKLSDYDRIAESEAGLKARRKRAT